MVERGTPRLAAAQAVAILRRHGFALAGTVGSHQKWRNAATAKQASGGTERGYRSKSQDSKARDAAKVPHILRSYRVAEFQGTRSDDEIAQRKINPLGGLLAADPGDNLRGRPRHRMHPRFGLQLVQKLAAQK